jgi:hypothetical protein
MFLSRLFIAIYGGFNTFLIIIFFWIRLLNTAHLFSFHSPTCDLEFVVCEHIFIRPVSVTNEKELPFNETGL